MSTRSFLIGFAIFQIFNLTIHAQTSGATAPEVTQFEPVDTTDLVNLATGDFTYSIPAIVIPGAPGGGYPIALSYHAGILTNQEASWVGLGWNLSPGAVARAVRGYPDDFRGEGTITTTTFDTIYGYSVGFGWDTWSAGIKWDNHGGFGGEISVGFKESGVGVSASYYKTGDGKTSYGVGVNYGTGPASFSMEYQSGGGFGVGASYKTGDFSWGLNYSNGSGVGISASGNSELNGVSHSNSNLGFSLRSGFSYKLKMGPNFVASSSTHGFGAVTTTSTTQAELNFLFFSLGTSKTNIVARSHTAAYGYLYMDEVGKSIDGTTLIEPYYNSSSDKNIDVSSLSSSELTAFLDKLQNNKKVMDKTFANSINSIGYDFYFQDFGSKYQELAAGEGYQYVATYSSDYMAPTYDLYTFSGQGMSGMARPIYGNLGFVVPTDPIVTKKVKNTDFYFYPYRNLYWAMAKGESGLGTNYENYFGHALTEDEHYGFWKKPEKSINMIFIDDPGLVDDFHFFEDSGNPIDRKNLLNRLRNRSKRVSYETDQYGKIEKITATKADGVCYVYGVIRNVETGAVTAGADPRVLDQAKVVQTKDDLNSASVGDQTSQYTPSDFAYSWNLAAVLSPDYLDNPPLGSIGPEDFGSYITFHYDLANPSYHYSNPLNSSDFEFIGKESNETKYYFEKTYGTKELYYLREAKTRSHTALFDQNYESDLRADSIAANNIDRMIFKKGNQFSVAVDVVPEIINDPQFQANILPYNGLFNEIIAVRKGLAQYTELPLFGSISTQYQCNLISYPINLRYVGTALNADYDLFLVEWPSGAGGCVTPLNEFSIGITSSARKLNDIRLVKNAKLNILKGESLVYSVNTINDNSDNARLYQAKVKFNYSYDLAKDTPNTISSVNPNGGRLTLQGIKYFASGNFLANPGYSFEYFNDATLGYGHDKHDPWGYYS
ncbi:MAG: hypothetical protein KDC71_04360, partial [Acidobacteria bacterium]|nr:hypothetical protein [Acidobacteriota bacterium]